MTHNTPASVFRQFASAPWLTGASIWSIAAASGALNAWGWSITASGLVAGLLVTLSVAAEILGVRLAFAVDKASREPGLRFFLALPLFLGVVAFNAYSGHRALTAVDTAQRAPVEAAAFERAALQTELRNIDAAIGLAPVVPPNASSRRARVFAEARAQELARLDAKRERAEARLAAIRSSRPAPEPIDSLVVWAIVGLVEGLKAFGLFAVSRSTSGNVRALQEQRPARHSPPSPPSPPSPNAGRDLARMRWAKA